jgi:hypothetical protein
MPMAAISALDPKRAAERAVKSAAAYLEGKPRLKANQSKSKVGSHIKLKFLKLSLWEIKGVSGIRPREKSLKRFRDKAREITRRNRGCSAKSIIKELKQRAAGRLGYFSIASLTSIAKALDGWMRARLRQCIRKQLKRARTRFKKPQERGMDREYARRRANARKDKWRIARRPILSRALPNKRFKQLGCDDPVSRRGYFSAKLKTQLDC